MVTLEGQNQGKFAEVSQLVAFTFSCCCCLRLFVGGIKWFQLYLLLSFCHGPPKHSVIGAKDCYLLLHSLAYHLVLYGSFETLYFTSTC